MYISPYCRLPLVPPNFMKFGVRGQLTDIITYVKFLVNRFGGYGVLPPPKYFPSTCYVALTTVRTAVQHCDSGVKLVCRPSGCCVYVPSTTWWRTELYCRRHYHCPLPLRFWLVAWTAAWSDWSVSIQLCCSKRTGICEQWSLCFISRSACVHVLLL